MLASVEKKSGKNSLSKGLKHQAQLTQSWIQLTQTPHTVNLKSSQMKLSRQTQLTQSSTNLSQI